MERICYTWHFVLQTFHIMLFSNLAVSVASSPIHIFIISKVKIKEFGKFALNELIKTVTDPLYLLTNPAGTFKSEAADESFMDIWKVVL